MSEIVKITTHGDDAVDRLPQQYRGKPGMEALARLAGDQQQALEDADFETLSNGNIALGYDYLLDQIGDVVGQKRESRTDAVYRSRLFAKIGENVSKGTGENLISVFKAIMSANRVYFNPLYPARCYLTAIGGTPAGSITDIYAAMNASHTGGVKIYYLASAPAVSFSFLEDPDPDGEGFGDYTDGSVGGGFATIL